MYLNGKKGERNNHINEYNAEKTLIHQETRSTCNVFQRTNSHSLNRALHTYKEGFVFAQLLVTPEPSCK